MGCCLALEMAQRGYSVDLIDLATEPMNGASLNNEGKLHLGFVYANDPTKETHRLMQQGALAFAGIIRKLTGAGPEALMSSQPFHYFVPLDSRLDMATLEEHFQAVDESTQDLARSTGDRYLGLEFDRYSRRNSAREHERLFSPGLTQGSFSTQERSVSPIAVAKILRRTVKACQNIRFIANTNVQAVDRVAQDGIDLVVTSNGATQTWRYSCVVNCLWDDKLRIDCTAGVDEPGPWLHRYKVVIHVPMPGVFDSDIPSASGVHGPYGDVVKFTDDLFSVSWYPRCMVEQSTQLDGRKLHDSIHKGLLPCTIKMLSSCLPAFSRQVINISHRRLIRDSLRELARYIPSMDRLMSAVDTSRLSGGVILAKGSSDIDDPHSLLHQRLDIGPAGYGPYITVNTGKYTMAPLFAVQTADMVAEVVNE